MKEGIFMRCNQNVFYHHFTFFVSDMSPNNLYKLNLGYYANANSSVWTTSSISFFN